MGYLRKIFRWYRGTQSLAVCALGFLGGCGSTVILIPSGAPVQLAEPVSAYVFVVKSDGTKTRSSNRVSLPAGWWVGDVPEDWDEPQNK